MHWPGFLRPSSTEGSFTWTHSRTSSDGVSCTWVQCELGHLEHPSAAISQLSYYQFVQYGILQVVLMEVIVALKIRYHRCPYIKLAQKPNYKLRYHCSLGCIITCMHKFCYFLSLGEPSPPANEQTGHQAWTWNRPGSSERFHTWPEAGLGLQKVSYPGQIRLGLGFWANKGLFNA